MATFKRLFEELRKNNEKLIAQLKKEAEDYAKQRDDAQAYIDESNAWYRRIRGKE